MPVVIQGFSSNNRIPGPFGEVLYGTQGQSAASIPLVLLLVGLRGASGTIALDTQVQQIFSKADADTYGGQGSEAACMAYDVFDTPAAIGVPLFMACPTGGGGVAASATATVGGSWTTSGQITIRVAGKPVPVLVGSGDSTSTVATNIAAAVNGQYQGRLPLSALGASTVCTFTCKVAGTRGNQHIIFADLSQAPAGLTLALAGGTAVTGGGVPLSGGTLNEVYTNLLATLLTSQFDTIALAANDATSLGAWKTQVDAQAAAPTNILQQVVLSNNGTLAAATTQAQTTLNDPLFQHMWQLNGETHPSRLAACFAAIRTATEQADPAAAAQYNNMALPGIIAAQSQKADWPSITTLISALNNSITPVTTIGDGFARVVRSITTKSLTSANPDYSVLDTSASRCPQFILKDLKLTWNTFAAQNPRVQADPLPGQRPPPEGVAYPSLWGATVQSKMVDYSKGVLSGTSATVPPIVINVIPPVTSFDPVAVRIMLAQTVFVAPNNAQVGISIRQSA